MKRAHNFERVSVKWIDSTSLNRQIWWEEREVLEYIAKWSKDAIIETIGCKFHEDKRYLYLVRAMSGLQKHLQVGEPFAIPKGCIVSIKRL